MNIQYKNTEWHFAIFTQLVSWNKESEKERMFWISVTVAQRFQNPNNTVAFVLVLIYLSNEINKITTFQRWRTLHSVPTQIFIYIENKNIRFIHTSHNSHAKAEKARWLLWIHIPYWFESDRMVARLVGWIRSVEIVWNISEPIASVGWSVVRTIHTHLK